MDAKTIVLLMVVVQLIACSSRSAESWTSFNS